LSHLERAIRPIGYKGVHRGRGILVRWSIASQKKIRQLAGKGGAIQSLAFSPDGRTLAGGNRSGELKLWQVPSGLQIAALAVHLSTCRSISFSPDGGYIATAGVEDTILLFSAAPSHASR
jgi:WD40 repeat protein